MDVFIDTDVILDYLTDREPFAGKAEQVFALLENKKVKGYASSLCFSNLYYLLRQKLNHQKAVGLLKELAGILSIARVDEDIIRKAIESDFNDFEDAIQYFTALNSRRAEVIVTRNIKDFKHSKLPVMTPDTMVKTYLDANGKEEK